jgi:seryl-tRNA synthetase
LQKEKKGRKSLFRIPRQRIKKGFSSLSDQTTSPQEAAKAPFKGYIQRGLCYTEAMLNLDFIYKHPDVVREGLRRRGDEQQIDEILRLAEQKRGVLARRDELYAAQKPLKEAVRNATFEKRTALNKQIKEIIGELQQIEVQMTSIDARLQYLLLRLPNIPHESVAGGDNAQDRELRRRGEPVSFYFQPREHWELGESLHLIDAESGVRVAGSRFVTMRGMGARLERALIAFMLDVHTQDHGYTEILPPFLTKRAVMQGAGQLPKFEDQAYLCTEDELFLNPTAEVPLVGMHSDTILPPGTLPLRYVAWTTAFRREAGSASRQTRGLLRLHQFNKVELFQFVPPEESYEVLEQMVKHAESILQRLELHYRVVELSAPNLPFASARTIDLEVWMPGQQNFVEISSISNCEAFQARRANIKYRPGSTSRAEYVHSLNGSGLPIGRTFAAILETYQQADGTVIVPKVLRPFMGTALLKPD